MVTGEHQFTKPDYLIFYLGVNRAAMEALIFKIIDGRQRVHLSHFSR